LRLRWRRWGPHRLLSACCTATRSEGQDSIGAATNAPTVEFFASMVTPVLGAGPGSWAWWSVPTASKETTETRRARRRNI
jgi:hypothetical protein